MNQKYLGVWNMRIYNETQAQQDYKIIAVDDEEGIRSIIREYCEFGKDKS